LEGGKIEAGAAKPNTQCSGFHPVNHAVDPSMDPLLFATARLRIPPSLNLLRRHFLGIFTFHNRSRCDLSGSATLNFYRLLYYHQRNTEYWLPMNTES